MGELSRLYRAYRERVAFFIVYIREAHPEDGWVLAENRDAGVREVARLYGGWPERLYLIGADGTIAYQGEEGPFGFHPEELEAAIERELSRDQPGEATATATI